MRALNGLIKVWWVLAADILCFVFMCLQVRTTSENRIQTDHREPVLACQLAGTCVWYHTIVVDDA